MKITIVTVTFNAEKTLEQTILSVLDQTYENIEYIIVDGKSTDSTIEIIKKYSHRIKWISEKDSGIYDAMNKGVELATGDYVQFLGADDSLYSHTTIADIVEVLEHDETIDILSGVVWMVNEKTHMQRLWDNDVTEKRIKNGFLVHHQGLFTKKQVLEKYPFNLNYKIVSDYEFILKTYFDKRINIKYISIPIAFYSLGGVSATDANRLIEHIHVMREFNLNPQTIKNYELEYVNLKNNTIKNNTIKNKIKTILKKIDYINLYFYLNGWKKHNCTNEKCRWCNNNREEGSCL